ncbi:MAG TPA: carboxypeptidase-like regulatory domain-containing protein [Pyrinomonadaceae bacterium]|nr:carboxypeptidase-like regulatory domain-containing protein [Pyrinomonadaceae bacterium]
MKKQNGLLSLAILITLFTMSVVLTYAQADKRVGGTKAGRPTEEKAAATMTADKPMAHSWEPILGWLNANPGMMRADGSSGLTPNRDIRKANEGVARAGGSNSSGGNAKWVWRLLELDKGPTLTPFPEEELSLVVPWGPKNPVWIAQVAMRGFIGTVFIPKEFQLEPARNERRAPRRLDPPTNPETGETRVLPDPRLAALRDIQISLFDLSTGKLEAQTTTDADGGFKFPELSAGRKALFFSDATGNLYFVGNVEACRNVSADGKGCTEMGPGGKGPTPQFTIFPEIGNAYHSYGRKVMR